MKRDYLIGLLIILISGGGYTAYELLNNRESKRSATNDTFTASLDNVGSEFVQAESITICSFNIQFLGHFKKKNNEALADLFKDFDIVVIQELVTLPCGS